MYNLIQKCFPSLMRGRILGVSGIENFHPVIDRHAAEVAEVYYPDVDAR